MENNKKARVIAYYLPQFHPIPENNKWWGKGFTEWTNVAKAQPLFQGHYQPRIPADLGFYDLRLPEVREAQADMAREAGIEGFCYWHYWFGNDKQLLERPFNEVLVSGKPDFPFCLGWANHSWTNKTWDVGKRMVKEDLLMKQTYFKEDYITHFNELLPAFKDKRYITVDNKPLFVVFSPRDIIDANYFVSLWNQLAKENGLEGIYFVGISSNFELKSQVDGHYRWNFSNFDNPSEIFRQIFSLGFDAVNSLGENRAQMKVDNNFFRYYYKKILSAKLNTGVVNKYAYAEIIKHYYTQIESQENVFPTIIPQWDRTARAGKKAIIWHDSTPELFKKHILNALTLIENKSFQHKILFLRSWNEWAEGNYVEPDLQVGHGYLDVLRECLNCL